MAFRTLLVCLRLDEPNEDVLAVTRDVAVREGAAVIGVVARQAVLHLQPPGAGLREPFQHDLQRFKERAPLVEQEFRDQLSEVRRLDWRPELTFGPAYEYIANAAGAADLVIAPLARRDGAIFPSGQAEVGDLVMRLGRPVLAVPFGAGGLALNTAMVCWVDKREARRAVADSLPLLKATRRTELVELVKAGAADQARGRLEDVAAWLAGHGVQAVPRIESAEGPDAPQLAGIAKTIGADLVVAGAFGHSRLREWAFGGVTRDFLLVADRCVLASH